MDSLFLNRDITIARPTAASAAATVMTKNTKICPLEVPKNAENDTNDKFIEFSISSIHINMTIAFLLIKTPITPIENNNALKIK